MGSMVRSLRSFSRGCLPFTPHPPLMKKLSVAPLWRMAWGGGGGATAEPATRLQALFIRTVASFGSETHPPKQNLDPKFGRGKIKFEYAALCGTRPDPPLRIYSL